MAVAIWGIRRRHASGIRFTPAQRIIPMITARTARAASLAAGPYSRICEAHFVTASATLTGAVTTAVAACFTPSLCLHSQKAMMANMPSPTMNMIVPR